MSHPVFRLLVAILVAGSLYSCSRGPSTEMVVGKTKLELQHQLDARFAEKQAVVVGVRLVSVDKNKWNGSATIAIQGSSVDLPVSVTSDSLTTIVTFDDQIFAAVIQTAMHNRFAILEGKYADFVLDPKIFGSFSQTLVRDKKSFVERLQVIGPIKHIGSIYFGSGCMAHNCTLQDAAWTIDESSGVGKAIVLQTYDAQGAMPQNRVFRLYGASSADELPAPLAEWAQQEGMTAMNITPDVPMYQAPPK